MPEFEMEVTIVLRGYESLTSNSEAEAIKRMEDIIESGFTFRLPLVQKTETRTIKATEKDRE